MKNFIRITFLAFILVSRGIFAYGQSGIDCNPNTFWDMQGGVIEEFTLINDTVTFIGNAWSGAGIDPNLAWCQNLDGGSFSPTFYSTHNFQQPMYYDGTDWITSTASAAPDQIFNPGSNGIYLYYLLVGQNGGSTAKEIVRYDGNSLINVYAWDSTRKATVADLAVDSAGNVFVFLGHNDGLNLTDTIAVISPAGQVIHKYPFAYDTYSAYGCFMLNGNIYIGLGGLNTTHPNSLIPVTFSGNTATAGTPIPMNPSADLASCDAGLQLAIHELPQVSDFSIYPNPADDEFIIQNTSPTAAKETQLMIFDLLGNEIFTGTVSDREQLSTTNWSDGVYFIQFKSGNKTSTQKLIVQH